MSTSPKIPTFYSERERFASNSPSIGDDLNRELQNLTLDGSTKHLNDQEILLDDPQGRYLCHVSLLPHQEDLPDRSLSFWQPTTDVDVLVEEQMPTKWCTALGLPTAVSEYERPLMAVHGSLIGDAGRFSLLLPPRHPCSPSISLASILTLLQCCISMRNSYHILDPQVDCLGIHLRNPFIHL